MTKEEIVDFSKKYIEYFLDEEETDNPMYDFFTSVISLLDNENCNEGKGQNNGEA